MPSYRSVAVTALALALVVVAIPAGVTSASAAAPLPFVSGLSAHASPQAGGRRIAITGSHFTRGAVVGFGSERGRSVVVTSPYRLVVTTPPHAAGTVDVRVRTGGGISDVTRVGRLTYEPLPAVTRVSPAAVGAAGGRVTVEGSGFDRTVRVRFGAALGGRVHLVSSHTLTVTAPPHAAGPVDVRVSTEWGRSTAVRFDYTSPPACTPTPQVLPGQISTDTTLTGHCVSRYVLTGPLVVAAGAALTLGAGVTTAADPGAGITVDGTLLARGSAGAPVTVTSDAATPAAGDWPGITVDTGGAATLAGTTLEYADTALTTATGTAVSIRGSILDSTVGIAAPEADADPGGVVDARQVWWGDATGPAPYGDGPPVEGSGVDATPWTGLVVAARPAGQPTDATPPDDTTCADIAFLGARGSGEAPQGADIDTASDRQLLGARVAPVLDAMIQALPAADTVRVVGIRYAAKSPPFAAFSGYSLAYYDAIWTGVDQVEATLATEHRRCPDERLVLAGYSQGALVIHLALAELAAQGTLAGYPIAAVELVADPARTTGDDDVRLGTAPAESAGVWTVAFGGTPLPADLVARTSEICHLDDAVCDTATPAGDDVALNPGAYGAPHVSYPEADELAQLGRHAASLAG